MTTHPGGTIPDNHLRTRPLRHSGHRLRLGCVRMRFCRLDRVREPLNMVAVGARDEMAVQVHCYRNGRVAELPAHVGDAHVADAGPIE
jgi:hypothetical protein